MDIKELSLKKHEEWKGKLEVVSKSKVNNSHDLAIAYTPGVAEPCKKIYQNNDDVYKYTMKGNTVAVITDGTAVLGLGDIGPKAALPVMEGKCVLFKEFAGINAIPICLDTKDVDEIIKTIKLISPGFGGINLEDISAPRCFEIEERLKKELNIPVFHDDQHGTAIIVLAGIINALKVVNKNTDVRVVVNGAGAAGTAITKLLLKYGFKNIMVCDKQGILTPKTAVNDHQKELALMTNTKELSGSLKDAIKKSDIFIGVSAPNIVTEDMVKSMNKDAIIFAMANPTPEIMPDLAKKAGAKVIGTGRSDFPNQVNNVLAFPGIFKGALKIRSQISDDMKVAAAEAIASMVDDLNEDNILPKAFDEGISDKVAEAIVAINKK
ncbi:malate dehydrogenase [Tepiditoga spiralis]|uniref:Malate dehydrogenase n=1 Tax=Tepiditoga spiralis TaxID=2108365 RepID=A0A7G1G1S2_9BACT|nr:NADP-dependent malic enzyme [Tepiditoga spiralis]BBE30201.1 malate dehydrogenase [Tepiditoga spiralis]